MTDRRGRSQRLDAKAVFGGIVCCALWGANAVAVKYSVPEFPPFGCAGIRFLISLPIIALVCLRARRPLWISRNQWRLAAIHTLFTFAQIGTFNWGTSHSLAGRASVLINVHPLFVAPLAALFLSEPIGLRGFAGLGAAFSGVTLLISSNVGQGGESVGDLVVLLSSFIFAVQTIAQKRAFLQIAPTTLLFVQSTLVTPLFLTYSLIFEGPGAYHVTGAAVSAVVFQGLVVSGICFTLWMFLLSRYPASQLAPIAFLTPLFGISFGTILRGEPLSGRLILAGLLVALGVVLVATGRVGSEKVPRPEKKQLIEQQP